MSDESKKSDKKKSKKGKAYVDTSNSKVVKGSDNKASVEKAVVENIMHGVDDENLHDENLHDGAKRVANGENIEAVANEIGVGVGELKGEVNLVLDSLRQRLLTDVKGWRDELHDFSVSGDDRDYTTRHLYKDILC